jgi:hypothetical protein
MHRLLANSILAVLTSLLYLRALCLVTWQQTEWHSSTQGSVIANVEDAACQTFILAAVVKQHTLLAMQL